MIGKINIIGPIGKYEENGKLEGVALLDILLQEKSFPEGTQIVEVNIASPGGYVDEGDSIFNYLISLRKKYSLVNTVQVGNIASIATKIFLAGQNRMADPAFDFMIHNPWVDPGPGNATYQADMLESLLAEEDKLRKFYSEELDITQEGIGPLMDQETTLTAQQLMTLGFATSIKSNIKVMAMKNDKGGFDLKAKVFALYKSVSGSIKALDVPLADGTTLSVDAPNEDSMVNMPATLDGNPAPDGDYPTAPDAEGMSDVITVKGGMVTAVVEQPSAQAKKEDRLESLEKVVSQLADSVSALVAANKTTAEAIVTEAVAEVEKKAEARIVALKNEIGTVHTPKKAATVYASSVDKNESGFRSIAQGLAEKAEARKKQINRN